MPRGVPFPDHLRFEAALLREQGLPFRYIACQLDVPESTIARWLRPGYAEKQRRLSREAKQRRRIPCPGCGKLIWYTSKTCISCHEHRYWTRERVVEAIQRWAAEHGQPPTASQWMHSGDDHPAATGIYGASGVFDSWNAAIAAAGFTPRRSSPGPGRSTWTKEEAQRLRNEGLTDAEIGRRFGVTPTAIGNRLGRRGELRKPRRPPTREERIEALRKALHHQ
jgi:Homing endonuclease associated repeat